MFGRTFKAKIVGDKLEMAGIDWGRPLQVVLHRGSYVLTKCAAHSYWGGRGAPRKNAPTSYRIFRLEKGEAELIKEAEPGRSKEAIQDLLREVEALSK